MTKLLDNTFAYDMVWQAGKWLGTYDVWCIIFNQLQHLSSQEPTLTGLISKRYNIRSHGCHMVDIGGRRKVRTLLQCFVGRAAEEFQCLDTQAAHAGGHFLLAKILRLKFCVLKAVQQEIHQVRHNCFCTFVLQQVYQTIVGRRREFYKDLAYNTNSRFLLISYQNMVKFIYDLLTKLFIAAPGRMLLHEKCLAASIQPLINFICLARNQFIRTGVIQHLHEQITEDQCIQSLEQHFRCIFESRVFLQSAQVDGDDWNIRVTGFCQCTADKSNIVGSTTAAAGLRD